MLGVDNLIFIAILSDKLPPEQRDRARIIGLSLALLMRLGLLASITWVMSLTAPLFSFWRLEISWRDLILIAGGLFLLVKATTEIHDRVEGGHEARVDGGTHAPFWPIVAQIVVLDAVFSLDSVITAVGMVDELYVMMAAVIVAVAAMLFASKPLTAFINKRPSLIILCLGFLLMIGLVLVVDGLGLHIPKGYVYAAIGFSVLIEILNQLAHAPRQAPRRPAHAPAGRRSDRATARRRSAPGAGGACRADVRPGRAPDGRRRPQPARAPGQLGHDSAQRCGRGSTWTDPDPLPSLRESPHRELPVGRGGIDKVEGVVRKEDVLALCVDGKPIELQRRAARRRRSSPPAPRCSTPSTSSSARPPSSPSCSTRKAASPASSRAPTCSRRSPASFRTRANSSPLVLSSGVVVMR